MSAEENLQRFRQALTDFESSGAVDELTELFGETAELERPEVGSHHSRTSSPEEFWQAYRAQFDEIASTFTRSAAGAQLAVLEWTADGKLAGGTPIRYAGVSLLEYADDGRISRFATYFDTAAFITTGSR
ncbi:nuclear transport factor 2 family protein [Kribbella sp. CA-293567]|uniref:nuclear transport factor 2 family protein n=1 Tax=Kribbella sp. CA-293567 TaxID=3002436 RepID=UPI0022DE24E7|nr:nuclear transport factor 2 family protein [Kribbella sp. CA-293567]WBQ08334.1 nuclear transport factor 2 family protein [Kribbella sp. CA-293567]